MQRELQTFPDLSQRSWTIRLNFANLRTIRDATGVDLGKPVDFGRSWAELLSDDDKALTALWLAIEPQATAQGIDNAAWLESMNGECVETALEAMSEAVINFTQPQKRGMVEDALEVMKAGWLKAVAESRTLIRTAAEQGAERALQQLGIGPQKSPASSATSTKTGRSAKRSRR